MALIYRTLLRTAQWLMTQAEAMTQWHGLRTRVYQSGADPTVQDLGVIWTSVQVDEDKA